MRLHPARERPPRAAGRRSQGRRGFLHVPRRQLPATASQMESKASPYSPATPARESLPRHAVGRGPAKAVPARFARGALIPPSTIEATPPIPDARRQTYAPPGHSIPTRQPTPPTALRSVACVAACGVDFTRGRPRLRAGDTMACESRRRARERDRWFMMSRLHARRARLNFSLRGSTSSERRGQWRPMSGADGPHVISAGPTRPARRHPRSPGRQSAGARPSLSGSRRRAVAAAMGAPPMMQPR